MEETQCLVAVSDCGNPIEGEGVEHTARHGMMKRQTKKRDPKQKVSMIRKPTALSSMQIAGPCGPSSEHAGSRGPDCSRKLSHLRLPEVVGASAPTDSDQNRTGEWTYPGVIPTKVCSDQELLSANAEQDAVGKKSVFMTSGNMDSSGTANAGKKDARSPRKKKNSM